MKRKLLIASFFAVIMLTVSLTSVVNAQNTDLTQRLNILDDESPRIMLDNDDIEDIYTFVNNIKDDKVREKAESIVRNVVNSDNEINVEKLGIIIEDYRYKQIPEEKINDANNEEELIGLFEKYWGIESKSYLNDPLTDLINLIIETILDRLGYVADLFTWSMYLTMDGFPLLIEILKDSSSLIIHFTNLINLLLEIPELIGKLLRLQISDFIEGLKAIKNEIGAVISKLIESIVNMAAVKQFIEQDVIPFLIWIGASPWAEKITVSGTILKDDVPVKFANITCRESAPHQTDNDGEFWFKVDSTAADDSIPRNAQFGMHNCQITVEKDGEVVAISPKVLSYVFADGEIHWVFRLEKDDVKSPHIPISEQMHASLVKLLRDFGLRLFTLFNKIDGLNLQPGTC